MQRPRQRSRARAGAWQPQQLPRSRLHAAPTAPTRAVQRGWPWSRLRGGSMRASAWRARPTTPACCPCRPPWWRLWCTGACPQTTMKWSVHFHQAWFFWMLGACHDAHSLPAFCAACPVEADVPRNRAAEVELLSLTGMLPCRITGHHPGSLKAFRPDQRIYRPSWGPACWVNRTVSSCALAHSPTRD